MPVRTRDAPAAALAALSQALRHIAARRHDTLNAKGGGVNIAKPMELYSVRLADITNADFLDKAIPNGWRYLVVSNDYAMADVRGPQPEFANITRGKVAERLEQAAVLAEKNLWG